MLVLLLSPNLPNRFLFAPSSRSEKKRGYWGRGRNVSSRRGLSFSKLVLNEPSLVVCSREQFARPRQNLTTCQTISNFIVVLQADISLCISFLLCFSTRSKPRDEAAHTIARWRMAAARCARLPELPLLLLDCATLVFQARMAGASLGVIFLIVIYWQQYKLLRRKGREGGRRGRRRR